MLDFLFISGTIFGGLAVLGILGAIGDFLFDYIDAGEESVEHQEDYKKAA